MAFDFIVVGAGSAGCVLANRLTEDPDRSVLLLEAGGPDDADEVAMPAAFSTLFKTRFDWNFETVGQERLGGRRAFWPRAKVLGGCSSMNAMIYIRGNRADYDTWRDAHGADGWGHDDVLPYFVRAERNTRLAGPLHGTGGPLHVEDRRFTHELSHAWVDAAVSWGLKPNDDFNGASQDGAGLYQVTCRNGRRWSTADAYLRPALDRPNLTVRTHAPAERVVFDGTRAVGVAYRRHGVSEVAHTDGEVILAGGTIGSPQLLMLSGVGPAGHLREVGVEVLVDLPGVGENLHDHPAVPLLWRTRGTTDLANLATPAALLRWKLTGRGPFASNIGEAGGFLQVRDDLPDVQFHVAPTLFYDNGLREPSVAGFTTGPTLVAPRSRGRLRLRSADPRWRPSIDPAYYADPSDLAVMVTALRQAMEIGARAPLSKYLAGPHRPVSHALSDEELTGHVREFTQTLYHPVGTCAIGTVVDPALRVRGTEGLRVADASVMPVVPRGNTNAPAIMLAERAADLIRP